MIETEEENNQSSESNESSESSEVEENLVDSRIGN